MRTLDEDTRVFSFFFSSSPLGHAHFNYIESSSAVSKCFHLIIYVHTDILRSCAYICAYLLKVWCLSCEPGANKKVHQTVQLIPCWYVHMFKYHVL